MGIKKFFMPSKGKNDIVDAKCKSYFESIDDYEISNLFVKSITPELQKVRFKYGEEPYKYPLKTRISASKTEWLAKKFFASISTSLYSKVCDFYEGKSPNVKIDRAYQGGDAKTTNPQKLPVTILIPPRGDLRGLYESIHEITHALDIGNGDTATRMVLGEVAPQCMERLLDEFLLAMTNSEIQEFGFDRKVLEKDVRNRRLSTFFSRFSNAESLCELVRASREPNIERKYPNGDRMKDSRYMLAQIYATQFCMFGWDEKVSRVKSFISCVEKDDFYGANNALGMQIYKGNTIQRDRYILSTISAVNEIVKPKPQSTYSSKKGLVRSDTER